MLSGFESVEVCIGYTFKGEIIDYLPYDIDNQLIEPIYKKLDGWTENISTIKSLEKMPLNFIKYIDFLEKELDRPITIVSVGPDRSQTIFR